MTYPRVSDILPAPDFSKVREDVLAHATERGTKVHQICAAIAQGLWIPRIPEECKGYVESFQGWFDEYAEEVIYVEQELVDHAYGFMGHIDFFGKLKRLGHALIDYKTPIAFQKHWRLRMAAYNRLLEVAKKTVDIIATLQLHPEGKAPKMIRYEGTAYSDFNIFLGYLNGFNFLKEG